MKLWTRFLLWLASPILDKIYQKISNDRNFHKLEFEKLYYQMTPLERSEFDYLNNMDAPPKSVLIYRHYYASNHLTSALKAIDYVDQE